MKMKMKIEIIKKVFFYSVIFHVPPFYKTSTPEFRNKTNNNFKKNNNNNNNKQQKHQQTSLFLPSEVTNAH